MRYALKTPYRDGTTHVSFEPLDFMARLAALLPKPRVNLTRFHGVFAPHSKYPMTITPAKRGKGAKKAIGTEPDERKDNVTRGRARTGKLRGADVAETGVKGTPP